MRKRGLAGCALFVGILCFGSVFAGAPDHAAAQSLLGGEFELLFGATSGPFTTETDFFFGGALDVPLLSSDAIFGSLLGEVMLGWSRSSRKLRSVSPLALVGVPEAAVTATNFEVTTLQVTLAFKYKFDRLIQPVVPYLVFGPSFYAFFDNTSGTELGGDFIGGVAPQPVEIQQETGFPAGQGNVEVGANLGVGVDFYLAKRFIVGAEYRYNAVAKEHASYHTFGGKIGLRF